MAAGPGHSIRLRPNRVVWGRPVFAQRFVRAEGKHLVDANGKKLILRGTNLGNWMVAEGYMFHFEGGPQSAREIEALVTSLVGPQQAAK